MVINLEEFAKGKEAVKYVLTTFMDLSVLDFYPLYGLLNALPFQLLL